jgi:heat shock protein HspQ
LKFSLLLYKLNFSIANKRPRYVKRDKKIYHGIQELMEEDEDEEREQNDEDTKEEDEDEEDNEDPFVDNLIAQIDDLRNKVKIIERENKD